MNSAGIDMLGMSLFVPPSITRMDKLGSASANLPATTHPAVPPAESYFMQIDPQGGLVITTCNDNIHFCDAIGQLGIESHCNAD